jgi:hypothetical protein
MTISGVRITNLSQFRADANRAIAEAPRDIQGALRAAGIPAVQAAEAAAPRVTGALASSYSASVRGEFGEVESGVPYGAGAEWGRFGKWSGFQKYGAPPRFAGQALEQRKEQMGEIMDLALRGVIGINGWAT